jgi:hypothetical protein
MQNEKCKVEIQKSKFPEKAEQCAYESILNFELPFCIFTFEL